MCLILQQCSQVSVAYEIRCILLSFASSYFPSCDLAHRSGSQLQLEFFGAIMFQEQCVSFFLCCRDYVIKMSSIKDYPGNEGGIEEEEGVGASSSYKHGTRKPVSVFEVAGGTVCGRGWG